METFFRKPIITKAQQWQLGTLKDHVRPITIDEYTERFGHVSVESFMRVTIGVLTKYSNVRLVYPTEWVIVFPNGEVEVLSHVNFTAQYALLDAPSVRPNYLNTDFDSGKKHGH